MDTTFRHLIATNLSPSEEETRQILEFISKDEHELADIDAEIGHMQDALHRLLLQRARFAERIEAYKSTLSPIRRLPPEILAEIFILCYASHTFRLPPSMNSNPSATPLTLIHTCSRWRAIALGLPRLWTDVTLASSAQKTASQLKSWFNRAGNLPLSLCVICKADHLVMPYITRLRHMEIDMSADLATSLRRLPTLSFDLLQSIDLCLKGESIRHLEKSVTFLSNAPRLRSARFTSVTLMPLSFDPDITCLPWEQLNHLHFINIFITNKTFRRIMNRCTNLLECAIEVNDEPDRGDDPSAITLPSLRTLKLTAKRLAEILDTLTLPNLKAFQLSSSISSGPSQWSHASFTSFLQRSSVNLEAFSICGMRLSRTDLLDSLRCMPSLIDLDLSIAGMLDERTLDHLRSRTFVPKLEVIGLHVRASHFDSVVDLVKARTPDPSIDASVSRLRKVSLWVEGRSQKHIDYAPLKELLGADGLSIISS